MRSAKLREVLRLGRENRDGREVPKWNLRHMPGQKLTADGLTKALQGQAFGRFLSGLKMINAPVKKEENQEIPKVLKAQVSTLGGLWWKKLLILGSLMVKLGKEWSLKIGALLVALVSWKCDQQRESAELQPRICAFRAPGNNESQLPIRPMRNPLESQAGQRGYAVRAAGSNDGVVGQPVRIDTSEMEVPQWWDHAALQHLPGGRDRWVILENRWLVRIHGETRRRSFEPIHRSCPVRAEQIGSNRSTLLYPMSDPSYANRQCRHDTWTSMDLWSKDFLWKGSHYL